MSMIGSNDKLKQAAAGAGGGPGLNVEEVFSTYLYESTNTNLTITNGVNIPEFGGMTWFKPRTDAKLDNHIILDTERTDTGSGYPYLITNSTAAQATSETPFYAGSGYEWLSDGFKLGQTDYANGPVQGSNSGGGVGMASWTFRKAPKFFDVVTFSQTGSNAHTTVSHNLGSTPGMIIVKSLTNIGNWYVSHRSIDPTAYLILNSTNAASGPDPYGPFVSSSSTSVTFGQQSGAAGDYVAYLFAHNDGDGDFGPNGDADIIKCGSYTGNGSSDGPEIDLGFEPQWLLVKRASGGTSPWQLLDTMRGFTSGSFGDKELQPNASNAENEDERITLLSTGFKPVVSTNEYNASGNTYIYIAIRRGPLVAAEDKEDLFYTQVWSPNGANPQSVTVAGNKNFIPDFLLVKPRTTANNWLASSRLTGGEYLNTNTNAAATSTTIDWGVKTHYGYLELGSPFNISSYGQNTSYVWSRAPGYFDVVAYTGDGTQGRSLIHNLQASPELILFKSRSASSNWPTWCLYTSEYNAKRILLLNDTRGTNGFGGNTDVNSVSSTDVNIDHAAFEINTSGRDYICYLFSSLDGVSKVGSYTGNGSSQTIDCGFTSGARFILIKRTDNSGDWYVWDHRFGITSGDESHFSLNTNAIQSTADDSVDPNSSGFIVNQVSATNINVSSATYIFYAIA